MFNCRAENGCFLRMADKKKWDTMLRDQNLLWRKKVLEIFEYYTDRTPGSFIENKDINIAWHHKHADVEFGEW